MRYLAALLAFCIPAFSAANLSVAGITSQQVIINATLSNISACTITVSPSVPDVDNTVFTNANDCFLRDSSIVKNGGKQVTLVIGSRRAQWDKNGVYRRSRSLAAATQYVITVTDGSAVGASVTVTTRTIQFGLSHSDPLASDPARPGQYLIPEFTTTSQSETINDPQTGAVLRRIATPGQEFILAADPQAFQTAFAIDAGWSNPNTALLTACSPNCTSPTNPTSYTGAGSGTPGFLFLRNNNVQWGSGNLSIWANLVLSADVYQVRVTSQISNAACVGNTGLDDCKIQVCLTADGGASCWSNLLDQEITAASPYTKSPVIGDASTNFDLSAWRPTFTDPLSRATIGTSTTTVSVASDGVTITWVSGTAFKENVWGNGTYLHFSDASAHTADCQMSSQSLSNGNVLTLASNTCLSGAGFTVPSPPNITLTGNTFGIMIRKKTNTADTVRIAATSFSTQGTLDYGWPNAGSILACGQQANGLGGAYCMIDASGQLYWVYNTGQANFIGGFRIPAVSSTDTWSAQSAITYQGGWQMAQDPNGVIYGSITENGVAAVVAAVINDPNHTAIPAPQNKGTTNSLGTNNGDTCAAWNASTYSMTCRLNGVASALTWKLMTPASLGQDIVSQLVNFTAGQPVQYNSTNFPSSTISIAGMVDGTDLVGISRTSQDTPGWIWRMTMGDGDPANAGGTGPHIVAAMATWQTFPNRYCVIHGEQASTPSHGWLEYADNPAAGTTGSGSTSGGWRMTFVETSIPAYNPGNPVISLNISSDITTFGTAFAKAPTTVQVGDYLNITTASTGFRYVDETMQVLTRVGNALTLKRVANQQAIAGPATIFGFGSCGGYYPPIGDQSYAATQIWWNALGDPHGTNSTWAGPSGPDPFSNNGTTSSIISSHNLPFSHSAFQGDIDVIAGDGASCAGGLDACYYTMLNLFPPSLFSLNLPDPRAITTSQSASFAGAVASGSTANNWQSHTSSVAIQRPTIFRPTAPDAFPLVGTLNSGTFSNTGGSGRLWKMTTTVGSTPDDLSGHAILNRKRQPTVLTGGRYGMVDISGPGAAITDGAGDQFKYCIARVANECVSGSAIGDIYANFPYMFYSTFNGTTGGCIGSATSIFSSAGNYNNMICVGNSTPGAQAIVESYVDQQDLVGVGFREVTKGLSRWLISDVFWNAQYLPDQSWALFHTLWMNNTHAAALEVQIPQYSPQDAISRTTFLPVQVQYPAGSVPLGTSTADIVFGYLEYGTATQGYCTQRLEACVANAATINPAVPFQYASTDSFSHLACATGCTIQIPGLPGHVVYWYPRFFNGGGTQIGGGPVSLQATYVQ